MNFKSTFEPLLRTINNNAIGSIVYLKNTLNTDLFRHEFSRYLANDDLPTFLPPHKTILGLLPENT